MTYDVDSTTGTSGTATGLDGAAEPLDSYTVDYDLGNNVLMFYSTNPTIDVFDVELTRDDYNHYIYRGSHDFGSGEVELTYNHEHTYVEIETDDVPSKNFLEASSYAQKVASERFIYDFTSESALIESPQVIAGVTYYNYAVMTGTITDTMMSATSTGTRGETLYLTVEDGSSVVNIDRQAPNATSSTIHSGTAVSSDLAALQQEVGNSLSIDISYSTVDSFVLSVSRTEIATSTLSSSTLTSGTFDASTNSYTWEDEDMSNGIVYTYKVTNPTFEKTDVEITLTENSVEKGTTTLTASADIPSDMSS